MTNVVPLIGREQIEIPLDSIVEDVFLPRKRYSEEALQGLAASLSEKGMMHQVLVVRRGESYALIAGSRRVRAARIAGYTHIGATVTDHDDPVTIVTTAIAENVQREDLDPLEEANAYAFLCKEYGLSLIDVAKRVGRPVNRVRERLKLLDLAEPVQQLVADEVLSASTASRLAHIPTGEQQLEIAQAIVEDHLGSNETTQLIKDTEARHVYSASSSKAGSMTARKYLLKLKHLTEQMLRDFSLIEKLPMTPKERAELMAEHVALEQASVKIRDRISALGRVAKTDVSVSEGNVPTARNHRDEWPPADLKLFENPSLSDEVIAKRTGRTVTAVKSMRSESRRTRRRRA